MCSGSKVDVWVYPAGCTSYLATVAAQHSHVGCRDSEQPTLSHSLQGAVQQVCWGAIGVQVNGIIGLLQNRQRQQITEQVLDLGIK